MWSVWGRIFIWVICFLATIIMVTRELHRLLAMPFGEREKMVGRRRSDLISAGILIFNHLYVISEKDRCTVIYDGLREGVPWRVV